MPRLIAALTLLTALVLLAPAIAAQDAEVPVVPAPEECEVDPRDLAALAATATVEAGARTRPATPGAATETPAAVAIPDGEPVRPALVRQLARVSRERIACANAGDVARALAFFTDGYISRVVLVRGTLPAIPPPSPRPEDEREAFVAVRDARALPDGRIGAYVVTAGPPSDAPEEAEFYVFVAADGRWLIDERIVVPEEGTPTGA